MRSSSDGPGTARSLAQNLEAIQIRRGTSGTSALEKHPFGYEELLRNDHVSVWLLCWSEDQDTGFHDHDLSAGAVAIVAGQVREERLTLGGPSRTRVAGAGEDFTFSATGIHRVSHAPGESVVTIHAYSPPLWRMGAYEILPDGSLRRHSISHAEELRPI